MTETDANRSDDDRPATSGSTLAELVALALSALEDGGEPGFREFLSRHEVQADAIRERVTALRAAGFVDERGAVRKSIRDDPEHPARIGEFRVLERLGGGGMGVVFVAEQDRPRRRVALKILRPEFRFFENARERFRREIEVLAALQHPGIVPVFAGGEDAGVQYLVMELVEGATLEQVLARLAARDPAALKGSDLHDALREAIALRDGHEPRSGSTASEETTRLATGTWVAACLRITRRVAEALAHAHDRGVLHRDVKPSNIMLTLDGRVLLLDFGLARDEKIETLTQSGSQIGTPAYMSPEQIQGRRQALDARTDVYSLGVTLFELLTLRSPFAADSVETTRSQVLAGNPPALRALNREVPRDVETVCLAAIDRDSARRYAGASDFAGDIGNVLELRPARAQRASAWLRLWRTAQRHPAKAIAILATTLLLLLGPSISAYNQRLANRAISAALERANHRFDLARGATETLLSKVASERLLDVPGMQPLRRELLTSALDFYERLLSEAQEHGDDSAGGAAARQAALELTEVAFRAGKLANELGRSEVAMNSFRRGIESARLLCSAQPDDPASRDWLAKSLLGHSITLKDAGRFEDSLTAIDEATQLHRAGTDAHALIVDEIERASILGMLGRIDEAIAAHVRARRATDEQLALAEGTERHLECLRLALRNRCLLVATLSLQTLHDRGTQECAEALAFAHRAVTDELRAADLEVDLLCARLDEIHGHILIQVGRFPEARSPLADAKRAAARCLEHYPTSGEALRIMATVLNDMGAMLQHERERSDIAEDPLPTLEESAAILRRILELDPNAIDTRANLAATLINVGAELRLRGIDDCGRAQFEEAIRLIDSAPAAGTEWPSAGDCVFNASWYLALCHRDRRDHRAAVESARRIVAAVPHDPYALRIAAGLLSSCLDLIAVDPALDDATRARFHAAVESDALTALRSAAANGCKDLEIVTTRSDFEALRGHPDFTAIAAVIRSNAEQQPDK